MRFIRAVVLLLLIALLASVVYAATTDAHVPGCRTTKCDRRIHERRAHAWCNRHRLCVEKRRFNAQPRSWRDYYRAVIGCEKGDQPGDNSRFIYRAEWSRRTAWSAGLRHGYPSWYEEGNAVIRWTKIVGFHSTKGWPNCP